WYDGDLLVIDIGPHIQLGPVRDREHPHALARIEPRVEGPPQLGALVLGVPGMAGIAVGKHSLLGAALFLVAARAADGSVILAGIERLAQRRGLHDVGIARGAMVE